MAFVDEIAGDEPHGQRVERGRTAWAGGGERLELGPEGFTGKVCQIEPARGRHPRSGSGVCKGRR